MTVQEALANASDPSFRARAVHEYGTIRRTLGDRINWDTARIGDFGCGLGIATASFAVRHPRAHIFGSDIADVDPARLRSLFASNVSLEFPHNLHLRLSEPGTLPAEFTDLDLVFAWSVFEHVRFDQIVPTMRMIKSRLNKGAYFFVQIEPLYFSPRGSHLYRYTSEAWAHLLYQTEVFREQVMRSNHPEARKLREWDQFITLNRATAEDIAGAAVEAGFSVISDERNTVEVEVPPRLSNIYRIETLLTKEIRLLLKAPD